ncbi:hypothetical protein PVK06_027373 [Gossypium arboreum]|uniref:Retrovirus-related Pol polyprotein LINE-1 n=1 Tax=Gossypium arboreum TaxID=29729 RepID=A0ABR0P1D8_GOSAR|nr:hypothetical protein PVK06_027373 [Gossypium arboreum]
MVNLVNSQVGHGAKRMEVILATGVGHFCLWNPNSQKQKQLWDVLKHTVPMDETPRLAIGDFNVILDSREKRGGRVIGKRCALFSEFMDSMGLHDLGFSGPNFTWNRGEVFERLDRAICNDAWSLKFPLSKVLHLQKLKSDHRPIKLSILLEVQPSSRRPFRFLAGWVENQGFSEFIKDNWSFMGDMMTTHATFTDKVKLWNKEVYGHIMQRKIFLKKKLDNVQKVIDRRSSTFLQQVELEIHKELESVLHHEELLWKQKARCDWLVFGDRNTRFFHRRTLQRRKQNRILALKNQTGEWVIDEEELKQETVNFYKNLYGEQFRKIGNLGEGVFPRLASEEIKKALFDMAPLKAPGSDGLHTIFYQSQWESVGPSICEWIKKIFSGDNIELDLNNSLIVLIPKVQHLECLSQFRLISVCSILYKLVMKVIANRFKMVFPKFIGPEQAGFVAGRNINDNIIIAQEVIHSMKSKQKNKKWMAIKIDLEKAYDRVRWDFIDASFQAAGIPDFLRNVIMSSISNSTMQDVLETFCGVSGHNVNLQKSNMVFSKGVDEDIQRRISGLFGFQVVQNLDSYLGVPLFHKKVTNNTLRFVVDKVKSKLCNWDARQLSFAGRITLTQAVLLSILSCFMQSMRAMRSKGSRWNTKIFIEGKMFFLVVITIEDLDACTGEFALVCW